MTNPIGLTRAEEATEHQPVKPRGLKDNEAQSPEYFGSCVGCGKKHGSVVAEIQCMRAEIIRLRAAK